MNDTPTPITNETPLMTITVNRPKWRQLASLVTPTHEHGEGMNECHICDRPVVDAAIERIADLERQLAEAREQRDRLAEALKRIANNNVRDEPHTCYAYELGRMEGIAKIALADVEGGSDEIPR